MKLNRTHQLLVCADGVNILGGSVHIIEKNAETLVVATKENGPGVNSDKLKYMVMSRDRNAGRNHSIMIDNSSFERLEEFKYLGTTLTNQNSIQEDIKEQIYVRECLLFFGAEFFVFQFAIQKYRLRCTKL